jgi:glycosyltransferase involved in cell wall biosynthesis
LPHARRGRPLRLLRSLEQALLIGGAYASCPSSAMSAAITVEYGSAAPLVLYNAFPWLDRTTIDGRRKDRHDRSLASIHWCSQTLGPGRGIEDLVDAMLLLTHDVEVHFRGRPVAGMERFIRSRLTERWQRRVFFHSLIGNDELLSRIAEHDIGFAGESPDCRSRDLTVTNKILQYLLAGLAVVASDTAGQREAAERAKDAIALYPSGNPAALARIIDRLIATPDAMARAKSAALQAARTSFCWERQESALLNTIGGLLPTSELPSDRRLRA